MSSGKRTHFMKPKRRKTPDKEPPFRREKKKSVSNRSYLSKTNGLASNRFTCDTCGKSCARKYTLKQHQEVHSGYKRDCTTCGKTFTNSVSFKRHVKRHDSRQPQRNDPLPHNSQPAPPQAASLVPEDSIAFSIPQNNNNRDNEMISLYRRNWGSIRTHYLYGRQTQDVYNLRLGTAPTLAGVELTNGVPLAEGLRGIFPTFSCRVKLNLSFGFVLRNIESGELRYYHSSFNNGLFLTHPITIASEDDFENFVQKVRDMDVLQHALHTRPDTKWVVADITNVTVYANKMPLFYIGAAPHELPDYISNNVGLNNLIRSRNSGARYRDNFCLFRCLALKQGYSATALETRTMYLVDRYTKEIKKSA